ncbi:Asp-tRNA(Asn)/Glu-tRNA(Gln) amidotransferase A subunit family amidase [Rhodoligotrophos appendicifer]|uniref:amidase n=1 Tax=Rhodoligotrophos appendicifer TaxID=987056 RepID=UPI001184B90E|nr:amidase [Rhodoligotrophos appendicifer]
MQAVHAMGIAALGRAYASGALSPVEVIGAMLQRIEALNPALNAFYLVDHEGALRQARLSEQRWREGQPLSPLDGVATSVKDALPAIGWPAYRGSLAHSAETGRWDSDAPAIAHLREAGVVLLGKTTMPDFGILASGYSSKHGITRNPWRLSLNPGGSSSGAAVAVAAGLNTVAIGTDIVGSIRLPASFCGLFGLKPSQGRVPYYPPNDPALAAGPLTRSVEDAALLMNVVTRPDPRDFTALAFSPIDYCAELDAPVGAKRIGVLTGFDFGLKPDADVVALTLAAAERFTALGCDLVPVELAFTADDLAQAELYYKTRCYSEFSTFPDDRRKAASVIDQWTATISGESAAALFTAMVAMRRMRELTMRLFDDIDFLVLPTVHRPSYSADSPAPDPQALFEPWANCFLFNLTEQPASSVPCGFTPGGSPVGMQIVGRRFDDVGVLQLSRAYERLTGAFASPPDIPAGQI